MPVKPVENHFIETVFPHLSHEGAYLFKILEGVPLGLFSCGKTKRRSFHHVKN